MSSRTSSFFVHNLCLRSNLYRDPLGDFGLAANVLRLGILFPHRRLFLRRSFELADPFGSFLGLTEFLLHLFATLGVGAARGGIVFPFILTHALEGLFATFLVLKETTLEEFDAGLGGVEVAFAIARKGGEGDSDDLTVGGQGGLEPVKPVLGSRSGGRGTIALVISSIFFLFGLQHLGEKAVKELLTDSERPEGEGILTGTSNPAGGGLGSAMVNADDTVDITQSSQDAHHDAAGGHLSGIGGVEVGLGLCLGLGLGALVAGGCMLAVVDNFLLG